MKNENDLRVIKTENNIRDSFLNLLQKKSLREITVREICESAKCSRNTFYVHYQDKDALYNCIVDECITRIKKGFSPLIKQAEEMNEIIAEQYLDEIISGFKEIEDTLQILLETDNTNIFYIKLIDALYQNSIELGKSLSSKSEVSKAFLFSSMYTLSGLVGYMVHWIRCESLDSKDAKEILKPMLTTCFIYDVKHLE